MESAKTMQPMGVRLLAPATLRRVSGTTPPIGMRHLGAFGVTCSLFADQNTEARWLLEMSP
jgi:hypothetical protein